MRKRFKYIEERLLEWADWNKKGNGFNLGFPSKTPEQKLRESGGVWVKVISKQFFIPHPRAEEVEHCLVELVEIKRFLALVVRTHYLDLGTIADKAKHLRVSYSQYRVQLENAKHWLLGRLKNSFGNRAH